MVYGFRLDQGNVCVASTAPHIVQFKKNTIETVIFFLTLLSWVTRSLTFTSIIRGSTGLLHSVFGQSTRGLSAKTTYSWSKFSNENCEQFRVPVNVHHNRGFWFANDLNYFHTLLAPYRESYLPISMMPATRKTRFVPALLSGVLMWPLA